MPRQDGIQAIGTALGGVGELFFWALVFIWGLVVILVLYGKYGSGLLIWTEETIVGLNKKKKESKTTSTTTTPATTTPATTTPATTTPATTHDPVLPTTATDPNLPQPAAATAPTVFWKPDPAALAALNAQFKTAKT